MSKFNNTDNNDLNLLFNATKWIINLYSELFELENADCKESTEYEEKVNELKRAIALEDSLYDKVNLEFLAAYLYKNMNMFAHNRLAYDFMDILSMDDERLFVRRLIRKIVEKRELEKTPHGNLYGAAALEKAVKDDFVNHF